jgi:hypothetical protein
MNAERNHPTLLRFLLLGIFLIGLLPTLGLSACDPCQALSNRICDCQPTPGDQQRCRIARGCHR